MKISELLKPGAPNAITARELEYLTGLPRRAIVRKVNEERQAGSPICASYGRTPGYYLANGAAEMEQYCRRLNRRLKELQKIWKSCRATTSTLAQ